MGEKFFTLNRKKENRTYIGPCRTYLEVPVFLNGKKAPPLYFGPRNQILLSKESIPLREPEIITVPSKHQPRMGRIYSIDEAVLESKKIKDRITDRTVTLYRQNFAADTKPRFTDVTLTFYNKLIDAFSKKSELSPNELMKIPISIFSPDNIIRVNVEEQAKVYYVMQNLGALVSQPEPAYI